MTGSSSQARHARRTRNLMFVGFVLAGVAMVLLWTVYTSFRVTEVVDGETVYVYGDMWSYDFRAYTDAAARLADTGTLYQEETLAGPYRPGPYGLYMYSPVLGTALLPAADASISDSSTVWFLLRIAALILACAVMPVRPVIRVFAFALAVFSIPVLRDLAIGNVSVLLLLPLAIAWHWMDRPVGSIAQAIAIAIRPTFALLVIWQLLRRRWSAVAWTLGAGVFLAVLTLPFVGIDGYVDYLTVLRNMTDVTGVDNNQDIGSALLALGAGEDLATLGLLAGFAFAVGAIIVSMRRDREVGFMVTIMASLLLSPLLWDHYLALLVLPAAFLAERGRPWALALPLLAWLPSGVIPLMAIASVALPFLARDREHSEPQPATTTENHTETQGAPA